MKLHPLICNNNLDEILEKIQDFIDTNGTIKGMAVVDKTDSQIIIVISPDKKITKEAAEIWWSGYTSALGD